MTTRPALARPTFARPNFARSTLARVTLGLALATALAGPSLAQAPREPAGPAGSFAGAVLAATTAERDADYATAARYLREALEFEATDEEGMTGVASAGEGVAGEGLAGEGSSGEEGLRLGLLRALVLNGDFDGAVETARMLEEGEGVGADPQNLIVLSLVTDALRAREWNRALALLDVAGINDLEELLFAGLAAWAHAGGGDRDAALEVLDELEGGPEWVQFYADYTRGMVAEVTGDADGAATAYRAALARTALGAQLRETYTRLAAALAGVEARGGDADAALLTIDDAVRAAGSDPLLTVLREDIEAGRAVRPHVADVADGASELLYGLGMALTGSSAGDLARTYLQFARALNPEAAAPLIGLASVEELAERPARAIALYDQVGEGDPLSELAELQRGLNLADLDRLEEAEAALRALHEERPDDLRTTIALGNTLALAEKWADAAALYDEVLERFEDQRAFHWQIFYRRGIAHERLGDWPAAEKDFLTALDLRPEHPPVLNYLGYSWIDQNMNLDRGLEMIRTAVRLQPNSGAYVDSLGWAYYRLGRYEDAVRELERALGLETSDPVIHDHLGDAYWRVGREREARYQWGHALRMDLETKDRRRIRAKLTNGLEPIAEGADPVDATKTDDRA